MQVCFPDYVFGTFYTDSARLLDAKAMPCRKHEATRDERYRHIKRRTRLSTTTCSAKCHTNTMSTNSDEAMCRNVMWPFTIISDVRSFLKPRSHELLSWATFQLTCFSADSANAIKRSLELFSYENVSEGRL